MDNSICSFLYALIVMHLWQQLTRFLILYISNEFNRLVNIQSIAHYGTSHGIAEVVRSPVFSKLAWTVLAGTILV